MQPLMQASRHVQQFDREWGLSGSILAGAYIPGLTAQLCYC